MEKRKSVKPNKLLKRILAGILAFIMLAGSGALFLNKALIAEALFNPEDAVVYRTFRSKVTVDNSVLFIGTYIVHKDALNDKIYDLAVASARESGQSEKYYKSEISDGQWFDQGNVDNGVKGISTEGTPVEESNIDPLYVTHYVGADGILKDAKSLAPVSVFDLPDPYDLTKLPELQDLLMQYTSSETATSITQEDFLKNRNSKDTGKERSDVYYYQLLSTFFGLGEKLRDDETNRLDKQLNSLNILYIQLKAEEKEDEAEVVFDLMDKVDARRRAVIMGKLVDIDNNLLNTLYNLSTGTYYTPYRNFKTSATDTTSNEENTDTSTPADESAIKGNADEANETLKNSLEHDFTSESTTYPSFVTAWLERLGIITTSDGWWTVLTESERERKKAAEEANKDNPDYKFDESPEPQVFSPDTALLDAIGSAMSACSQSYTTYIGKALMDKDDLLGHEEYKYSISVINNSASGELSGEIKNLTHVIKIRENVVADKEGELNLLKTSLLKEASDNYQTKATAGVNSEYASLTSINAKATSMDDQQKELESERSMLEFLIDALKQRDTAANALVYVNERITWTENLEKTITEDDFKPYATNSVEAHLVWLKKKAQEIKDSDKSMKSELDQLREKKQQLQQERDKMLDNNNLSGAKAYDARIAAVDQDINAAGGGTGSGSGSGTGDTGKMADQLTDKAMDKLADNADADLSGIANAMAGMGENDKLQDLRDKAAASGATASSLSGLDNAIAAANASATGNTADMDALLAQLEELFGKSLDEMDDRELAIADATLSQLARGGMEPAAQLAKQLMNRLLTQKNKYTYRQYTGSKVVEYVNLRVLSDCSSYRYFYDESKATATVTKGGSVYIFRRGSDQMHNESMESEPEQMTDQAVYEGELFVGEADTSRYFKCVTEYVHGTKNAIILTSTMQSAVNEYVTSLEEYFSQEEEAA